MKASENNNIKIPYKAILIAERACLDVYDVNDNNTNVKLVNGKLVSCDIALREASEFEKDKDKYIKNFLESRVKSINSPTAVSRGTSDIISYLSREQRTIQHNSSSLLNDFLEIRKDNLKLIQQEFKKERKALLETIKPDKEQSLSTEINKNKDRGYSR